MIDTDRYSDGDIVGEIDGFTLRRMEVRIRYLKRIVYSGSRITFDDARELAEWREQLGRSKVMLMVHELDELISGSALGELC